MLSEFVLFSQEGIKLNQGNLFTHFRKDRKQRDRPVVTGDLMAPSFKWGTITDFFQALGNSEQANEELICLVKVGSIGGRQSLMTNSGILS